MKRLFRSFGFAIHGIYTLIRSERNFQIHFTIFGCALALACYFSINPIEWCIILITSGLVFVAEALNTAIERLTDSITKEKNDSIRMLKDIAAGAVLIAAFVALIVGILVFYKYFAQLFH
jgi:diacylglycerol kinase